MLATLVIFLREGVEASMIVTILLAYLDRIGQRRYFRDVVFGVLSALGLAAAGGVAAYLTIRHYDGSKVQTIFETVTFLVAAAVLTGMTFWMRNHARTISAELRARTEAAMSKGARRGLFLLAFQAVGREGLETAVFTLAVVFSTTPASAGLGALIGLVLALGLALAIYRLRFTINLGAFFKVVGVLLMVFAAALLVDATENLQQLGWLPSAGGPLWDTSRLLAEGSSLGDVAHSFLGYVQRPNPLELAVWLVYVGVAVLLFLAPWRRRGHQARRL
ncbi:FTR1 family protein [Aciditerrimonas ferrireducens]|uniref:FTR1 family protein n=1 Tax=Aciditerrimonas ferrireducens TaxID=667306 RepID=A0ABV6C2Q2_9ACTN|nr:FTR1 family protein [Aciditerrimonas ferrireducens]MCK4177217.1 FTR1 family protein [Aciditerrimonas ferrireducens]